MVITVSAAGFADEILAASSRPPALIASVESGVALFLEKTTLPVRTTPEPLIVRLPLPPHTPMARSPAWLSTRPPLTVIVPLLFPPSPISKSWGLVF